VDDGVDRMCRRTVYSKAERKFIHDITGKRGCKLPPLKHLTIEHIFIG
jgi:hypothetical protein